MKQFLLATAAVVMFAGPALSQSPAPAPSMGERSGVNSLVGVTPSTQDFVTQAAISDMFEIQSSTLAKQKVDAPTKTFAEHMVMDHEKTSTEMKGLIQAGTVKGTLPAEMDSSHKSKLDKLNGLNGVDFTKEYHSQQVSAHKDAVSLFERYSKGGDNAELKSWAGKTLPALQAHLKMAEDLNK